MSDVKRIHDDGDVLRCPACDWFTDRLEASRRIHHHNRCAHCGGPLSVLTGIGFEHLSDSLVVTTSTADRACSVCAKVAELRPYGPNSALVCFACGMNNEAEASKRFLARFDAVRGEGEE